MKPQKCPDCVFRFDRPDLWETCLECADSEEEVPELEVPGSEDEELILEVGQDEVVDAMSYGLDIYDYEGEVWDD